MFLTVALLSTDAMSFGIRLLRIDVMRNLAEHEMRCATACRFRVEPQERTTPTDNGGESCLRSRWRARCQGQGEKEITTTSLYASALLPEQPHEAQDTTWTKCEGHITDEQNKPPVVSLLLWTPPSTPSVSRRSPYKFSSTEYQSI